MFIATLMDKYRTDRYEHRIRSLDSEDRREFMLYKVTDNFMHVWNFRNLPVVDSFNDAMTPHLETLQRIIEKRGTYIDA